METTIEKQNIEVAAHRTVIQPPKELADLGLGELWAYRALLFFLVWRDVKVRYKQTALGLLWVVVEPLIKMVLFVFGKLTHQNWGLTPRESQKSPLSLLYLLVVLALLAATPMVVRAQAGIELWSTPVKLFEGESYIQEPDILSDSTGAVHAVWSVSGSSDTGMLYYARWDEGGWTTPVDVIAAQSVMWPSATVDLEGRLHVVWHGSGDQVYHSWAPVTEAGSAHGWADPVALGMAGNRAHIVSDSEGRLHLGYSARGEAGEVRYGRSIDGGVNWSYDVSVAWPSRQSHMADNVRLAVLPGSTIHIVWTEWDLAEDGGPAGVFYARSTDDGETWTSPLQMAGEGYDEINVVAVNQDEIHLAWNGAAGVSGRYHRWSSDGGKTWSDVGIITPPSIRGGSTGPAALGVDSAGTVHAAVDTHPGGQKVTTYAYWKSSWWAPLFHLAELIPGYSGNEGNEESALAISEGNRVHILFNDGRGLWHTTKRTSAPAVTGGDLPTPTSEPDVPVAPTADGSASPSTVATEHIGEASPAMSGTRSLWPVWAGLTTSSLLVVTVILIRGTHRRK